MDEILDIAAQLVRQARSGRPFPTDRERVEHHVRLAVGGRRPTIIWAENPIAGVRRAAEVRVNARTKRRGALRSATLGAHVFRTGTYRSSDTWPEKDLLDQSVPALAALATVEGIDAALLRHGRDENRASRITPGRRLRISDTFLALPSPSVGSLYNLMHFRAREVCLEALRGHSRGRLRVHPGAAVPTEIGETAYAAAAGLFAGYVIRDDRRVTVILVPRPALRLRNGRFHAEGRPAVEWPDGTGRWFLDGVEVPAYLVTQVGELTPAEIAAIPNQEVRRVVVEQVGWERFLTGARRIAQDDFGTLWATGIRLDGQEVRLVEVVNATAEPDGTHRRYFLRVPPATRTARAAVAWTFGFEKADDYLLAAAS